MDDEYITGLEAIKREGEINHQLLDQVMVDHLKHSAQVAAQAETQRDSDTRLLEALLGNRT